jgi:hypothetical protein
LQLAQDELRNDQRPRQEPGLGNVSNAPVDDHRRVENLQVTSRGLIAKNASQGGKVEVIAFRGPHHQSDISHEKCQRQGEKCFG